MLGSANKDYTFATDQLENKARAGLDVKWGVRPNLTADFTINTDFAQVEADEEQVNLTRFDLFFPEKRPFFLENASIFQFGAAQQSELFFSRRIGLSATGASGVPIDIIGGGRLSGKVGGYNIGILNMQTESATDQRSGRLLTPGNNFGVMRVQREVGRSNFGGIFVNREGTGNQSFDGDYNRAYGIDAALQVSTNGKLFTYLARTDSPASKGGSDYSGRVFYNFTNNLWQVSSGFTQVGDFFNPEVGYLPRRGYRRPEFRAFFQPQPKRWPWIRRISPHVSYNAYHGLANGEIQSSNGHYHFFEIQPARGGTVRHLHRTPAGPARRAVHRLQRGRQAGRHPARVLHLAYRRQRVSERSERRVLRHDPDAAWQLLRRRFLVVRNDGGSAVGRAVPDLVWATRARTSTWRTASSTPTSCRSR